MTACGLCEQGLVSLGGSAACFDIRASLATGAFVDTAGDIASLELAADAAPVAPAAALEVQVAVALALVFAVFIPLLCLFAPPECGMRDQRSPPARCGAAHRWVVLQADLFAMRHAVRDGGAPVKRRTLLGGAMTLLALAVIAAVGAVLIIKFELANTLT